LTLRAIGLHTPWIIGLLNIRERLACLTGRMVIDSKGARDARITVTLPIGALETNDFGVNT